VSAPLIDAPARTRIEEDLDGNLCVEAGAGTGKTTVLVRRIVALIRRGRARIDELAVITFTEKAAGELSARVRYELERAAEVATDPDERDRLEAALLALHRARIQTLHAFASDLLRERPVEARLDPEFETFDELGAEIDFDDAYRRWLDELLATSRPEVERALRRGLELPKVRTVVEAVHHNREVLPLAPVEFERPVPSTLRAFADETVEELERLGPDCLDEDDGAFVQIAASVDFFRRVRSAPDDAEVERLVLNEAPKLKLNSGRQSSWKPTGSCKTVKERHRAVRGELDELSAALRTEAISDLLPLAADFVGAYEQKRRAAGHADFDDLLIWARDLVRDDPHVRAFFHRRTPRVLVDEFQDTDPVQAELLAWICAPGQDVADWTELVPEPGSLFVVGDPKQSIYRFRSADISIYDQVKTRTLAGSLERLEQNFRSSTELLDWVNEAFDRLFVEEPGVQPPNTRLAGRVSMGAELGRAAVVVVRSDRGAQSPDEARREEARLLAGTISRAVREEHWPVRDRFGGDRLRPATWRDIAVLVPSRTGIEHLGAALEGVRRASPLRRRTRLLQPAGGARPRQRPARDRRSDGLDRHGGGPALPRLRMLGRRPRAVAARARPLRLPDRHRGRAAERSPGTRPVAGPRPREPRPLRPGAGADDHREHGHGRGRADASRRGADGRERPQDARPGPHLLGCRRRGAARLHRLARADARP